MDAQNASEAASSSSASRKPAASPKLQRQALEPDHAKAPVIKPPASAVQSSPPSRPSRSGAGVTSRPPDDDGGDANSEAETIVLPGKDGHSPSKIRKMKH